MIDTAHSPFFRNAVHCAVFFVVGLPLLFLARLDWLPHFNEWAAGFMALAALCNIWLLPQLKFGRAIRRDGEGFFNGVWLYPASLGVCFLIFPAFAVFAAWAVLSCGDAAASFFGRSLPRVKLPWNKKKSAAGLVGFLCCGSLAACLSLRLLPCPLFLKHDGSPEWPYVWTLAILASAGGALAESLDSEIDDNVRVPFASALALMSAVHFLNYSTRSLPAETHVQPEVLIHALIANGILGLLVVLLGFASLPATLLGMALGTLIYFYAHWQGFLLFTLFVASGSALSRVGLKRKIANGTMEANAGRRGIANVVANLLVPTLSCALYPATGGRASMLMAFAGALAAALADTASSEIGVLASRQPYLITSMKPVPHGTNGAVSFSGSFAAFFASALFALVAFKSGFVELALGATTELDGNALTAAALLIFVAGLCGTFVDSLLGATLEDKFPGVTKGTVNFFCTLTGAIVAGIGTEIWILLR